MSGAEGVYENELKLLEQVLDRQAVVDPLSALAGAINVPVDPPNDLTKIAFGIDSSVFLRLTEDPRGADILDYLTTHPAPLVLPGQAVQEFWNNRQATLKFSKQIATKFSELSSYVSKVDSNYGEFEERFKSLMTSFDSQFGYTYQEQILTRVMKMLELLQEHAHCSSVPRSRFTNQARLRKLTRTPPGFEDTGDGDFFVWADFLFGLLVCKQKKEVQDFEHIVLLTNDTKKDWSTSGVPHPVLTAEVQSLFSVPFSVWELKTFSTRVGKFYSQ
ncbi:PIN-like domain-containing protein [Nonomuraea gerenzanensis]|uniref:PIN-like domain-containing protein n=1 Tax=Nonomuraea gerenzanensis TaxID=93944 RepID=UPI001CD9B56A|nr:PIN-like domain-containing protein [Nonomuraea gerenzanensis]UBU12548.1 hypothetical protein LCN96_51195 [Nonomuraea gerenzanensis]